MRFDSFFQHRQYAEACKVYPAE